MKMMSCEEWFLKNTSGIFSLEKYFREQILGKVPHGRGTGLVQGDTHRAEMGLMCRHYRAAPCREELSPVCTWKAPSTHQPAVEMPS